MILIHINIYYLVKSVDDLDKGHDSFILSLNPLLTL